MSIKYIMNKSTPKTIVFITGAFVHHSCWDTWEAFFEKQGYKCLVPAWPFKDAAAAELRDRQPDERVASTRLAGLTDHFADFVRSLPEKPILIGHSIGGLISQLLLQRDLAEAAIAIHPVAPQGVIYFSLKMLRSVWGPLGLFTSTRKSYLMPFGSWQFIFTNGMSLEEQKAAYEAFTIPESKLVSRDGLSKAAHIDFKKQHAPLLIISGSEDHIVPAGLNYATYQRYKKGSGSRTDYKEFPGRNHFVLGQDTWRQNAEYIKNWLEYMAK